MTIKRSRGFIGSSCLYVDSVLMNLNILLLIIRSATITDLEEILLDFVREGVIRFSLLS